MKNLQESMEMQIQQIVRYRPNYMVATAGEKRLEKLFAAMKTLNVQTAKLDDAKLPGNVVIWRLTYPPETTSGPAPHEE